MTRPSISNICVSMWPSHELPERGVATNAIRKG